MKKRVTLSNNLINNPAFWEKTSESFYYSGHCHRGSAFESDDTCGNCDGANCDWCKKVIVDAHYTFHCYTDVICKDLVSQGIDKEIAADLAYSDYPCKTHYLIMPSEIPEETKKKIETPDLEVWYWCEENYPIIKNIHNLKNAYCIFKQEQGISWEEGLDYYLNQIDFWYRTNKK